MKILSREERLQQWATTRKRGLARYVLLRGVVASLPIGVVTALLQSWIFPPSPGVSPVRVYAGWLIMPLGFAVMGAFQSWSIWRTREAEFEASREVALGQSAAEKR